MNFLTEEISKTLLTLVA